MKRIKYLILFVGSFLVLNITAMAASASISVNKSYIENGNSVTATVYMKSAAAWNITISSSGVTSGCTQKFADASTSGNNIDKSFSVTCKSTSVGIINFSLSGDITSSDGTNIKLSGSKQVTVTTPRAKSTNNKLNALSVDGYDLTPAFSADVKEYAVNVPSTVDKITINATKADTYSSISGTGEKEVSVGLNAFEIVVTSETGVSNVYKINVNVADQNPIKVKVDNVNYTVVKEKKNLTKPELFDETTIKIGEFDIPAFVNNICKYTLVGLKDEKGNINLFIYDKEKYYTFNEFLSNRLSIVFLIPDKVPDNYLKKDLMINETKVVGYKNNDSIIVYGMNLETGKKNFYSYDSNEKTLQIFDLDAYNSEINNLNKLHYIIYGLGGLSLLLFLLLIIALIKNKKKLKKTLEKINKK
jgi:hypothetical protein